MLADLHGKPVIQHVIDRARKIAGVEYVVLATPFADAHVLGNAADTDAWGFEDVADADVLKRFASVAMKFPIVDTIMRLTGDCPLLKPHVCERVLDLYRATPNCEYAWTDTSNGEWPDGLDCEIFSRSALMWAHRSATDPVDREHVTPWLRRHVKVASLPAHDHYKDWPKLSIDTQEDLERVRAWQPVAK